VNLSGTSPMSIRVNAERIVLNPGEDTLIAL